MDVTCERCSTAYEFDDALVSERGTTVKCTNCGHQFKVRRPQPAGAPERWLVRTIDGRELEFRALRELQSAIAQAVITRDDVLSRGGSRPRRLGSIAELEPFFVSAGSNPSHSTSLGLGPRGPVVSGLGQPPTPAPRAAGTMGGDPPYQQASPARPVPAPAAVPDRARVTTAQGIGVTPMPAPRSSEVSIAIPLPRGPDPDAAPTQLLRPDAARAPAPPPPPRRSTPPPPPVAMDPVPRPGSLPGVIVPPSGAPPLPASSREDQEETTRALGRARFAQVPPAPPSPPPRTVVDDVSAPTAPFEIGSVLPPVKVRAAAREDWSQDARTDDAVPDDAAPQNQHTASVPPLTPTPATVRHSFADDLTEPRFSNVVTPPGRTGAAKWIAGVVLVGIIALFGATVGRTMLTKDAPSKPAQSDARIDTLLAGGEKALGDGDLESAKEQFDKASVLAERDPRAAADLARLAAIKADVEWLRVRILADGDPELATAKRDLEQSAQRARKAADHAAELAPTDHGVVRSRIDALRLAGDLGSARKMVGGISAASAQPDNALTLAALDLAEAKPDWPTVLGRLRAAISTDGNLGRARAMLVYALAKSGDTAGARAELDRLAAPRPHAHPLVNALRAFLGRTSATLDPNALPDASAKPAAGKPASSGPVGPSAQVPREPREPREPRAPVEPRSNPEEHVQPPSGPIDTSDLPGVKAPTPAPTPAHTATPAPTAAPAPTPALPPGVDTSDLPGFKP